MAIEPIRGCGYRKVGGTYLIAGDAWFTCDRLPMPLKPCPHCGQGFKFTRGPAKINASIVFGDHNPCTCWGCDVCEPPDGVSYILWVGKQHYPTTLQFVDEAKRLGISRRISAIPKDLVVGETVVYLAHPEAVNEILPAESQGEMEINGEHLDFQPRLCEVDQVAEPSPGIFASFVPTRIERLVWKRDATEELLKAWTDRGITPVIIPDGEVDHAPDVRL